MTRSQLAGRPVLGNNRLLRRRDKRASSVAKPSSVSPKGTIRGEPQDVVFPLGVWTIISPNGCIKCTDQPIPGFEELGRPTAEMQGFPNVVPGRRSTVLQPPHQATATQIPSTSQELRKRKRSPSVAYGHTPEQPIAQDFSDGEQDNEDASKESYTFYISDIDELRKFFIRRLIELTTKPLRPIVVAWIKLLEPKRLSLYGTYHKEMPEKRPNFTPPWWPRDVPYEEPSHLNRSELITLATDIMLQYHRIDKAEPRDSWVAKLQKAADYTVTDTPSYQFSSSKDPTASKCMKNRALTVILPDLFNTLEFYEQHFAQHELYEGTGRPDPGDDTRVTWHPLPRSPWQAAPPMKYSRRTKAAQAARTESDVEASGSETEVDNTTIRAHLQRTQQTHSQAQQLQSPSELVSPQHAPEKPASASQQDQHVLSSPTSDTSFGQLSEDTDAKVPSHRQHNDRVLVQNMYLSDMPEQDFTGQAGYNFQVLQPQQDTHSPYSAQRPFGSSQVPSFARPPYVFDAPCPPQDDKFAVPMASNNAGFPYEYEGSPPSTPMSHYSHGPFHGLPLDAHPNY